MGFTFLFIFIGLGIFTLILYFDKRNSFLIYTFWELRDWFFFQRERASVLNMHVSIDARLLDLFFFSTLEVIIFVEFYSIDVTYFLN